METLCFLLVTDEDRVNRSFGFFAWRDRVGAPMHFLVFYSSEEAMHKCSAGGAQPCGAAREQRAAKYRCRFSSFTRSLGAARSSALSDDVHLGIEADMRQLLQAVRWVRTQML